MGTASRRDRLSQGVPTLWGPVGALAPPGSLSRPTCDPVRLSGRPGPAWTRSFPPATDPKRGHAAASHSPARSPAPCHPPGPVLSILGLFPRPRKGDRGFTLSPPRCGQQQRAGQQPLSHPISPRHHHQSFRHRILRGGRICAPQPRKGTLEKVPRDGMAPLRFSPLSPHPKAPAAAGKNDVAGTESSQRLPRRASKARSLPADVGAVIAPRVFGSPRVPVSRATASAPVPFPPPPSPEAGSRCPAPAPSGVLAALSLRGPTAQPPRRAPDGPPASGPDAPARRRKAIPDAAGSAGQPNPLTAPPAPQPPEPVSSVRMVQDPFHGAAGCPNFLPPPKKKKSFKGSSLLPALPSTRCLRLDV